jgi:hypothetical protein
MLKINDGLGKIKHLRFNIRSAFEYKITSHSNHK